MRLQLWLYLTGMCLAASWNSAPHSENSADVASPAARPVVELRAIAHRVDLGHAPGSVSCLD